MTEEDTFRILKRRPFSEIQDWIQNWCNNNLTREPTRYWYRNQEILNYLNKNGWKGREYCIEYGRWKHAPELVKEITKNFLLWNDV